MSSPSDTATVSTSGRSTPDDGAGLMHNTFPRRSSTPAQSFLPPKFWAAGPHFHMSNSNNNSIGGGGGSGGVPDPLLLPRRTSFGTAFGNGGRLSALSALGMSPSNNPALYGYPSTTGQQSHLHGTSSNSSSGGSSGRPDLLQQTQQYQSTPLLSGNALHQHPQSQPFQKQQQQQQPSSQRDPSPSTRLQTIYSKESTPDTTPTPSVPSSPVQKPQKRTVWYLPGPDGLCVESRGRRRSEA